MGFILYSSSSCACLHGQSNAFTRPDRPFASTPSTATKQVNHGLGETDVPVNPARIVARKLNSKRKF
ncbi:MAG: hypothetical protein AAGA83_08705 [Cyanobacteria bacterium P01_F01_bin.116]